MPVCVFVWNAIYSVSFIRYECMDLGHESNMYIQEAPLWEPVHFKRIEFYDKIIAKLNLLLWSFILNKREEHQEISTVNQNISTAAAAATAAKTATTKMRTTQIAKSKGTASIQILFVLTSTNAYIRTWVCAQILFVRMTVVRIAVHRIQNQKKKNKNLENRKTKSEIPILSNPILIYTSNGNLKSIL